MFAGSCVNSVEIIARRSDEGFSNQKPNVVVPIQVYYLVDLIA